MKRNHRKLNVWRVSIELVDEIYRITTQFPKDELYSLSSQMRRAAIFVPSNNWRGLRPRRYKGAPLLSIYCKRISIGA
jgi:hypothetical protein